MLGMGEPRENPSLCALPMTVVKGLVQDLEFPVYYQPMPFVERPNDNWSPPISEAPCVTPQDP